MSIEIESMLNKTQLTALLPMGWTVLMHLNKRFALIPMLCCSHLQYLGDEAVCCQWSIISLCIVENRNRSYVYVYQFAFRDLVNKCSILIYKCVITLQPLRQVHCLQLNHSWIKLGTSCLQPLFTLIYKTKSSLNALLDTMNWYTYGIL